MALLRSCDVSNWDGPFAGPDPRDRRIVTIPVDAAQFAIRAPLRRTPPLLRPFTNIELDCLQQNNDYIIVRGSLETDALIQTAKEQLGALTGRVIRASYPWAYGYQDPAAAMTTWAETYDALLDSKIGWIDLEDAQSFSGMTQAQGAAWMQAAWQALRDHGYRPGVYTSPYYWRLLTGSMPIPPDVLVWLADWNGIATLDGESLAGTVAVGHQYQGSVTVCSLTLDLSVFDGDTINPPTPAPQPEPQTQYATEDELQRLNSATVTRFVGLGGVSTSLREAATVIDTYCGSDAPQEAAVGAPQSHEDSIVAPWPTWMPRGQTLSTPKSSTGVIDAPITWPQFLGGVMSDVLVFLLAFLPGIAIYVSGVGPINARVIVGLVLSGIVAGLIAVQKITSTDGLSMRLRAMGQIRKGE